MIHAELGFSGAVRGTAEYSGDYSAPVGGGNRQFCIVIRLPTDATLYFVYLFLYFYPTCFGLSYAHHQGYLKLFYIQPFGSCSYIQPFGSCSYIQPFGLCSFTVKPSRQTSPQTHEDEQHKHCMNQMVVY